MKKWIFMLLLAGSIQGVYAQKTEKKEKFNPNTPLFEELTDVKKKTDKFNLYLNMQGSFDAHFQNGFQEGDFNMALNQWKGTGRFSTLSTITSVALR